MTKPQDELMMALQLKTQHRLQRLLEMTLVDVDKAIAETDDDETQARLRDIASTVPVKDDGTLQQAGRWFQLWCQLNAMLERLYETAGVYNE